MTTTNPSPTYNPAAIRKQLLLFDKSRAETSIRAVTGKITKAQADKELEVSIATFMQTLDTTIRAAVVEARVDELSQLFTKGRSLHEDIMTDNGGGMTVLERIAALQKDHP